MGEEKSVRKNIRKNGRFYGSSEIAVKEAPCGRN